MLRSVLAIALVLGLGFGADARAGGKVDWSDYLEPAGARPMPVRSTPQVADTTPAPARGKTAKAAKQRTASKAKAKAKSKRKAPTRKARRR